jgi:hypothetical protein
MAAGRAPIAMKVAAKCGTVSDAWAVEVGNALDLLKPGGSMTRDTRESQ